MEGAKEKIAALRARYSRVTTSLAHYEGKVARQTRELERMNRPEDWEGDEVGDEDEGAQNEEDDGEEVEITEEDLRKEEEEIKELERKKKELEDRVSGMEKDLGGLLR